jgi:hypothetical protein
VQAYRNNPPLQPQSEVILDRGLIERSTGWEIVNAVILPVLQDGTGNGNLAGDKLSLGGLILAVLAPALIEWGTEVVDAANTIWVGGVCAWIIANIRTDEKMDPVRLSIVNSKATTR